MIVTRPSPGRADGRTHDALAAPYGERLTQLDAWMRYHSQRGEDGKPRMRALFGPADAAAAAVLRCIVSSTGRDGTFTLADAVIAERCGFGDRTDRTGANRVGRIMRKLSQHGWVAYAVGPDGKPMKGSGGKDAWKVKASTRRVTFLRPTVGAFLAAHPQLAPDTEPTVEPQPLEAVDEHDETHAISTETHAVSTPNTHDRSRAIRSSSPDVKTNHHASARESTRELPPDPVGGGGEGSAARERWLERLATAVIAQAGELNNPGGFARKARTVALEQLVIPCPAVTALEPEPFAARVLEAIRTKARISDPEQLVSRLTPPPPPPPPPPAPKVDAGHVRCVACSLGSELEKHPDEQGPGCSICDGAGQLRAPVPGINPEQDPTATRLVEALPGDRGDPWTLSSRPPRDRGGSGDNQRAWVVLRRWPGAQDLAQARWDAAAPDRIALAEQRAADRAQRAAMEQQRAAQRAAEKAAARPQPAGPPHVDCAQHGRQREDHEMPGICWQCGEAQRHSSSAA